VKLSKLPARFRKLPARLGELPAPPSKLPAPFRKPSARTMKLRARTRRRTRDLSSGSGDSAGPTEVNSPETAEPPWTGYDARMRFLGFAMLALLPGCYLSHERGASDVGIRAPDTATRDATVIDARTIDTALIDAGPTCTFGFRTTDGVTGMCAIGGGSTESCAESAMCICAARTGGTPTEVLACAGWDLTPRGAITLADFCTVSPPERMSLTEALEGFLGPESLLDVSPACAAVPALVGSRPFDLCGAIATELCRCMPDCDLDDALGSSCLDLSADQVGCIVREVFTTSPECTFAPDLRAIADHCGA